MSVYRFRIYFEDDESVTREIEIKSTQTFEDFHHIIQEAIGFDNFHPASFFVSNDTWRRGKEIVLLRKNHTIGLRGTWMHETSIASFVDDPHQKFIYEFDPDGGNWIIYVELMKIIPPESVTYPRVGKTTGIAPAQYKITTPAEIPVEDDEEELEDDSEDAYIHPEAALPDHYHVNDDDEPVIISKAAEPDEEYKRDLSAVEDGMDEQEEEQEEELED